MAEKEKTEEKVKEEKRPKRFIIACIHSSVLGIRSGKTMPDGSKVSDITIFFDHPNRNMWDSEKRQDRSGRLLTDDEIDVVYEVMSQKIKAQPTYYSFVDPKVMERVRAEQDAAAKSGKPGVVTGPRSSAILSGK